MSLELRKELQRIQDENAKLTTKVMRNRKVIAQKGADLEKIKQIEEEANQSTASESTQPSQVHSIKQLPNGMDKVRELCKAFCQCGNKPKYNGFCEDCVVKMKNDYENAMRNFIPIQTQYETLYSRNVNIEVKMVQIQKKTLGLKNKIKNGDVAEMDADLKTIQDEIDLLNRKIKVTQTETRVQQSEFERFVSEKNALQEELEKRIEKKKAKLKHLNKELREWINKNEQIQDEMRQLQEDLAKQSEDIQ